MTPKTYQFRLDRFVDSESECLAPCIPICCNDCPLGKLGEDFGLMDDSVTIINL